MKNFFMNEAVVDGDDADDCRLSNARKSPV
jgi:hypothetical protein